MDFEKKHQKFNSKSNYSREEEIEAEMTKKIAEKDRHKKNRDLSEKYKHKHKKCDTQKTVNKKKLLKYVCQECQYD